MCKREGEKGRKRERGGQGDRGGVRGTERARSCVRVSEHWHYMTKTWEMNNKELV